MTRVLVVVLSMLMVLLPVPASGQQVGSCLDDLNAGRVEGQEEFRDPGTALPVLLVHGFISSADAMRDLKVRIQGFSVETSVTLFDYSPWALEWVVHPEIGDRLAHAIRCLADTSLANGGPGRVVVMAHSMGGLATRQALAADPTMGERVAVVITFGTPFGGSFWARDGVGAYGSQLLPLLLELGGSLGVDWLPSSDQLDEAVTSSARAGMTPDSSEMGALPPWPDNVAVFNNAGQFNVERRFFFWTSEDSYGDLAVDEPSATAGQQSVDGLGGGFTSECRAYLPDDILNGFAERAVQLAFLTYVIDQDPIFPYCNHFWLTQNQQLVDNALAQLAAATTKAPRVSTIARLAEPFCPIPEEVTQVLGSVDMWRGAGVGTAPSGTYFISEFDDSSRSVDVTVVAFGEEVGPSAWINDDAVPMSANSFSARLHIRDGRAVAWSIDWIRFVDWPNVTSPEVVLETSSASRPPAHVDLYGEYPTQVEVLGNVASDGSARLTDCAVVPIVGGE